MHFALGERIPKIVHQTFPTRILPRAVQMGRDEAVAENPSWDFRLYSDGDVEAFINEIYGPEVLAVYRMLRPEYGAARADLFRYLVVYAIGGAYLDIKSRFTRPIDTAVGGTESFIIAQWRNAPGAFHQGIGLLPDLAGIAGGEYQQWHVVGAAGHPFLRAVIVAVLANIECYNPWMTNVGRIGVIRLTGPIIYTHAIEPIRNGHPHVFYADETCAALEYSAYKREAVFTTTHYSKLTAPIVKRGIGSWLSDWMFVRALMLFRRAPV